ncbi:TPA_exp: Uncharacterized protein A8136_7110 [Trichophyton benhamiae CBS 112371]|uniref:Aminoglycoside phosphotransferase domain-containing protein n=1 Tax=Arthroderma benhamiae (strain ATCC MYA-4681 / CBS 112371) TaxID=663331 RepID=D4ASY8_ARTBC|nr:uncharacterized protein ARB_07352 [Trichophyton benhamiae CBS 112371]EFE33888.1 hypothetical protein ARB_07352 [Trichophyton benhamiae CBS 112371]DAA76881.1 TPA_exp: Uncharacterized protein A8136_7110 [Trichophyton benhamiae CBS 112371]
MANVRWVKLRSEEPPAWLRLQIRLAALFDKYRGETRSRRVKRLPFKRIIKFYSRPIELEALQYIQKHTTIPIPRVRKVYDYGGERQHMVMDAIDGQTLDSAWPGMTDDQRENVVQEFTAYVQQLRSLVPPKEGAVGSSLLGPGYDHRLGDRLFGPFDDIAHFHYYVRRGMPLESWDESVKQVHGRSRSYTIKYAHGDMCPNNVLVKGGRIVAIVDWEFAGWYPEYWEYTKIHYGYRPYREEFFNALEKTMTTYPEELKAETAIWRVFSTFHYDDPIPDYAPKWEGSLEEESVGKPLEGDLSAESREKKADLHSG